MRIIGYTQKYKNPVIMHTDSISPNVIGGRVLSDGKTIALVMADGNMILLPIGGKLPETLDEAMDARKTEMELNRSILYDMVALFAIRRNSKIVEQTRTTVLDPEDGL